MIWTFKTKRHVSRFWRNLNLLKKKPIYLPNLPGVNFWMGLTKIDPGFNQFKN